MGFEIRTDEHPAEKAAGAPSVAEKYRWRGPGPEPAKWRHEDGTIVYRSYADYCDD